MRKLVKKITRDQLVASPLISGRWREGRGIRVDSKSRDYIGSASVSLSFEIHLYKADAADHTSNARLGVCIDVHDPL